MKRERKKKEREEEKRRIERKSEIRQVEKRKWKKSRKEELNERKTVRKFQIKCNFKSIHSLQIFDFWKFWSRLLRYFNWKFYEAFRTFSCLRTQMSFGKNLFSLFSSNFVCKIKNWAVNMETFYLDSTFDKSGKFYLTTVLNKNICTVIFCLYNVWFFNWSCYDKHGVHKVNTLGTLIHTVINLSIVVSYQIF